GSSSIGATALATQRCKLGGRACNSGTEYVRTSGSEYLSREAVECDVRHNLRGPQTKPRAANGVAFAPVDNAASPDQPKDRPSCRHRRRSWRDGPLTCQYEQSQCRNGGRRPVEWCANARY